MKSHTGNHYFNIFWISKCSGFFTWPEHFTVSKHFHVISLLLLCSLGGSLTFHRLKNRMRGGRVTCSRWQTVKEQPGSNVCHLTLDPIYLLMCTWLIIIGRVFSKHRTKKSHVWGLGVKSFIFWEFSRWFWYTDMFGDHCSTPNGTCLCPPRLTRRNKSFGVTQNWVFLGKPYNLPKPQFFICEVRIKLPSKL